MKTNMEGHGVLFFRPLLAGGSPRRAATEPPLFRQPLFLERHLKEQFPPRQAAENLESPLLWRGSASMLPTLRRS